MGAKSRYGPPKGNIVIGNLKARSLDVLAALATLVSNVLIFALPNFHPYCLLDFASGGLWGPNRVTGHLKATSEGEFIAFERPVGPPDLKTRFQPALICHTQLSFLSFSVSFGL